MSEFPQLFIDALAAGKITQKNFDDFFDGWNTMSHHHREIAVTYVKQCVGQLDPSTTLLATAASPPTATNLSDELSYELRRVRAAHAAAQEAQSQRELQTGWVIVLDDQADPEGYCAYYTQWLADNGAPLKPYQLALDLKDRCLVIRFKLMAMAEKQNET